MNIKRIFIYIVIILLLNSIIFIPKTFAISEVIEDGKNFLNSGDSQNKVIDDGNLKNVNSKIYNILLTCGIAAAVIVGAVLGITFIFSSAEGKAKISETLVPYIVGCFVVFGAFAIWKITINIGNNVEKNVSSTSTTYTKKDGKYYCDNCGSELGVRGQHNAKCYSCGSDIKGI